LPLLLKGNDRIVDSDTGRNCARNGNRRHSGGSAL
jgi:hypothetical protein